MNPRPANVLLITAAKTKPIVDRATAVRGTKGGPIDLDHRANLTARPEKENPQIAVPVRNAAAALVRIGPRLDGMAINDAANIAKTSIAGRSTNHCRRSR